MFNRIIVPTDGSEYAKKAEDMAINLAKKMDSVIVGLYVIDEKLNLSYESAEDEANEILDLFGKKVEDESITYEKIIIFADPAHDMKIISEKSKSDLMVIAAQGNSDSTNYLIGSVADNALKSVQIPILLVK